MERETLGELLFVHDRQRYRYCRGCHGYIFCGAVGYGCVFTDSRARLELGDQPYLIFLAQFRPTAVPWLLALRKAFPR